MIQSNNGSSVKLIFAVLSCISRIPNTLSFTFSANNSPALVQTKATTCLSMSSETTNMNDDKLKAVPSLPLPPPILSLTEGTWAYDTMSRRVDSEILGRTFTENEAEFTSPKFERALERFNALREELQNAKTTALRELDPKVGGVAGDEEDWANILAPFLSNEDTWLSSPWLVAEFYVYRRLLEALSYWDPDASTFQFDPFEKQKRAGLVSSPASAENVMARLVTLPSNKEGIALAAAFALWGNKMDLSLWPVSTSDNDGEEKEDVFATVLQSASDNLLHDDTETLASLCDELRSKSGGMVDIIVDNAGFELVTDLALADHIIASGVAKTVTFQLKSHPTFVSDAMEKDLLETVEYYANLDEHEYPNCKQAGLRWKSYLKDEKWICHEDNFWVQPGAMWEMPTPLRNDMNSRCDLAFVKGDANYRRLLGDRIWDMSEASFEDVVGAYFPCPVVALRTLKAEIGCGMERDQVERAKKLDDNWMVNGRFGVVHYGSGVPKS